MKRSHRLLILDITLIINEGLIKLCQEMGCTFIDNSTIVTDSSENLYEPDGEHVIQDYYPKWLTNMAQIAGLKA